MKCIIKIASDDVEHICGLFINVMYSDFVARVTPLSSLLLRMSVTVWRMGMLLN